MQKLDKILYAIIDGIGITSLLGMCAAIFFQVIARYVFSNAQPWPEELGREFFLINGYASIAYCMRLDGHLRITFLPDKFPAAAPFMRGTALLSICAYLIGSSWLVYKVMTKVHALGTMAQTLPVPLWILWCVIIFFLLVTAYLSIRVLIHGADKPEAVKE